jgi:hypothetical protein
LCRRERNGAGDDLTLLVKTIDLMLPEVLKLLFREAIEPSCDFLRWGWLFADPIISAFGWYFVSFFLEFFSIFSEKLTQAMICEEFLNLKLGLHVSNAKPRVRAVID